jgi:hypothetical protein
MRGNGAASNAIHTQSIGLQQLQEQQEAAEQQASIHTKGNGQQEMQEQQETNVQKVAWEVSHEKVQQQTPSGQLL